MDRARERSETWRLALQHGFDPVVHALLPRLETWEHNRKMCAQRDAGERNSVRRKVARKMIKSAHFEAR